MNLAVFGATGGTGRELVRQALAAGHKVTALVRDPGRAQCPDAVRCVAGSALDSAAVARTVAGADAVLSCLGAPLAASFARRGRIVGPATACIVEGMRAHDVRRLVVVSTYGAGETRPQLTIAARVLAGILLRGEIADKNAMEDIVQKSALAWTIVRPVNLKDGAGTRGWRVDPPGSVGFGDWICRSDLAAFMLAVLSDPAAIGRSYLVTAR